MTEFCFFSRTYEFKDDQWPAFECSYLVPESGIVDVEIKFHADGVPFTVKLPTNLRNKGMPIFNIAEPTTISLREGELYDDILECVKSMAAMYATMYSSVVHVSSITVPVIKTIEEETK